MILNSPTISGSLTVTGNIISSGSITLSGSVASASYADTASFVALAQSASNAVSSATASFANAFTVAGTLTAQTLVVQTITSSVDFVTGSTRFGSISANTHVFTGSLFVTGSLNANNTLYVSSSNVGIGIIPQELLHITGSSPAIRIGGARTYLLQIVDTDGRFRIHDNTAGERFTITSGSGNIGIGTISPLGSATEKTLHLSDGGAGYTTLYVTNNANTLRAVIAIDNVTSKISIGTQSNTDLRIVTNDTEKARFTANGEFGIGATPTSGNRFWVRGSSSSGSDTAVFVQNSTPSTLFSIRNDGIVTKPLQPAFRAGRSTAYNPGAATTIVFNSTGGFGFNVGGYYSTSTGRFTAPIAGIYNFTACVIWESVGANQVMDDAFTINVNGSPAAYSFRRAAYVANTTGIGGYYVDNATVLLNLTASQYVEIVNARSLTVHGNANYCYFTGYLVG